MPQPEYILRARREHRCANCDKPFEPRPGVTNIARVYCDNVCRDALRGPIKRENARRTARAGGRLSIAKGSAKQRGLDWELTHAQYDTMMTMPCSYCGAPLSGTGCGLDRLVPEKGYILGNVVPCCWLCNTVRSAIFTPAEMRRLGRTIAAIRNSWPAWRASRPPQSKAVRQRMLSTSI
jgi:hypothetical protein